MQSRPPPPEPPVDAGPEAERPTDAAITAITATTPVEALPLSIRAKNALDRAGVLLARDLLGLPPNRLSAIRGVGRLVAKEIQELRNRWAELCKPDPGAAEPAFFPGYVGDDLMVQTALPGLSAELLADAGLHTLSQVAGAPLRQIAHLASRHQLDDAAVRKLLATEHARADARSHPTTLSTWIDALLPPLKKRQHVRALYGLEGPRVGELHTSPRQLAEALGMTPAAIYIALTKAKTDWAAHPALPDLSAQVRAVVANNGGAIPFAAAGAELLSLIPHAGEPDAAVRAAALVHIVVEVDKDRDDGLRFLRLGSGAPWVLSSDDTAAGLDKLGNAADELAARPILAGQAEAHRMLTLAAAGSPLALLPPEHLIRLAALASRKAAASSRLELYPRGLDPQRALELSAAVLTPPHRGRAAPAHRRPLPRGRTTAASPGAR